MAVYNLHNCIDVGHICINIWSGICIYVYYIYYIPTHVTLALLHCRHLHHSSLHHWNTTGLARLDQNLNLIISQLKFVYCTIDGVNQRYKSLLCGNITPFFYSKLVCKSYTFWPFLGVFTLLGLHYQNLLLATPFLYPQWGSSSISISLSGPKLGSKKQMYIYAYWS